jgi:hypothetical protein
MNKIIKFTLNAAILNSMACGIVFAQESVVDIKFYAEAAGRAEMQNITIFKAEGGDFKYCQEEPDNSKLAYFELKKPGDIGIFTSVEGAPFCVKVIDADDQPGPGQDVVTSYYGPFVASSECAAQDISFKTKTLSHLYPQSDACILTQHNNGGVYNVVDLKANMDYLVYDRIWAEEYDIEIREKHETKGCTHSSYGDLIHKNALLLNAQNSGWSTAFDHQVGLYDNQQFCVYIVQGANADDPANYVYHKAGPFVSGDEQGPCKIEFRENTANGVYANSSCTPDHTFAFENIQYNTNKPTSVDIYDADDSDFCEPGTSGGRLETFELFPAERKDMSILDVTDKNSMFCITVDGPHIDKKAYLGPYSAIQGCKLTLNYNNEVIPTPECKGTIPPEGDEEIFMTFANVGTKDYGITLYELNKEDLTSCSLYDEDEHDIIAKYELKDKSDPEKIMVTGPSSDTKFCVMVTRLTTDRAHGPYEKIEGCQLNIVNSESIAPVEHLCSF